MYAARLRRTQYPPARAMPELLSLRVIAGAYEADNLVATRSVGVRWKGYRGSEFSETADADGILRARYWRYSRFSSVRA